MPPVDGRSATSEGVVALAPEDRGDIQAFVDVATSLGFSRVTNFSLPFKSSLCQFYRAIDELRKNVDDDDSSVIMHTDDPATVYYLVHPSPTDDRYRAAICIALDPPRLRTFHVFFFSTGLGTYKVAAIRKTAPMATKILRSALRNRGKHDRACVVCYESNKNVSVCLRCTAAMCVDCYHANARTNDGRCPLCRLGQDDDDVDDDDGVGS